MAKGPVFQHRHHKAIAALIDEIAALIDEMSREGFPATISHVAGKSADMMERDNERFDRARFIAACHGRPVHNRDKA